MHSSSSGDWEAELDLQGSYQVLSWILLILDLMDWRVGCFLFGLLICRVLILNLIYLLFESQGELFGIELKFY